MRYRIARTIHDFAPAEWDIPAGNNLSMGHAWQQMVESGWKDYHSLYVLFEDIHGPAVTMVASQTASFGRSGWREALLQRLTLVVTAPYSSVQCGLAVRAGIDLEMVIPEILAVLGRLCWREQRLIYAISNVTPEEVDIWRRHGFSVSQQPNFSLLDLNGASYDEYLTRLSGKDRAEIRRIRRRASEWGIEFQHTLLDEDDVDVFPLVEQVYARHGYDSSSIPLRPDVFKEMARTMPGEVHLFKGIVNGQMEGVLIAMRGMDVLWWPFAGLNYVVSRPTYLYFLLMDEMIRWSTTAGIRRIYGGMTNEKEKRGHGFRQQSNWFCFRAHPRPLNLVLTHGLPWLQRLIGSPDPLIAHDPTVREDGTIIVNQERSVH